MNTATTSGKSALEIGTEIHERLLGSKLTIAQSIRRSSDPYRASITSFIRREVIRSDDGHHDKKIFHFEDGSFLTFEVTYTAVEDGGGQ